MTRFKVSIGYDSRGRERNRYFTTLDDARRACNLAFARTGIVLSIVECQR